MMDDKRYLYNTAVGRVWRVDSTASFGNSWLACDTHGFEPALPITSRLYGGPNFVLLNRAEAELMVAVLRAEAALGGQ